MWPFAKKKSVDVSVLVETFTVVDVEEVQFALVLDDGTRETFVLRGDVVDKEPILASGLMDRVFCEAMQRGFFRFTVVGMCGRGMRWIPVSRVKEVLTTTWPLEVQVS